MEKHSRNPTAASPALLGETWFDPIEIAVRDHIRGFIEALIDEELDQALGRPRYQRPRQAHSSDPAPRVGYRHGRRQRQLLGSFGPVAGRRPSDRSWSSSTGALSPSWPGEAHRGFKAHRAINCTASVEGPSAVRSQQTGSTCIGHSGIDDYARVRLRDNRALLRWRDSQPR